MDNESQWRESENSISIGRILGVIISNLPWFVGSIIVTFIIAFLYLRYITPIYQVNAEILIRDEKNGEQGISSESVLQDLGLQGASKNINNEMRMLSSHKLMTGVIKRLHLNIHYSEPGRVVASELFDESPINFWIPENIEDSIRSKYIYKLKKNGNNGFIIYNDKEAKKRKGITGIWGDTLQLPIGPVVINRTQNSIGDAEYSITITSIEKATNKYVKAIAVTNPNRQSSILLLTLKDEIPKRGEVVLNTLIDEYQRTNVNEKNAVADSTMMFIDERLSVINQSLGNLEEEIENYKKANGIVNINQDASIALQGASSYYEQIAKEKVELGVLDALDENIKKNGHDKKIIPALLVIQSATFANLISQYNQLLQHRSELLLTCICNKSYRCCINNNVIKIVTQFRKQISNTLHSDQFRWVRGYRTGWDNKEIILYS